MKTIFYILFLLCSVYSCHSRTESQKPANKLSIAPHINQKDSLNHKIINTLEKFLNTKDSSLRENEYWKQSDFKTYIYPYIDLTYYPATYTPTLLGIIDTDSDTQKIIKLAYIFHSDSTNENQLANIYNLIANDKNGKIIFSTYLNYSTQNWETLEKGSITYKISPHKKINEDEIKEQQKDIQKLCHFFNSKPIRAIYYSCCDPVELFQIRGFDYIESMYRAKIGGIVYFGNQIFSGRNQEIYKHEIAHIYIGACFPHIHILLNEGMATLWGGFNIYDYAWHKQNFKKYILENSSTFQANQYFDTYNRSSAYEKTQISYMVGALICERTLRLYGRSKLFELFRKKGDIYEIISCVGLNEKNLNTELQKEALLPSIKL